MTLRDLLDLLQGDSQAERAVPPTGFTARITVFTAATMSFLAVFAIAFTLATGRLAERWSDELARTTTLRISASTEETANQVATAIRVLLATPGVAEARALTSDEQQALLEPWFGPDLPLDLLPIPQLIEIIEDGDGYDPVGLRARLAAEVPGSVLDDHTQWRTPLVAAATRLRMLGWVALVLIGASVVALITLAAQAALAANARVIDVMRLVGATDTYIARAFVRRFTLRSLLGAIIGTTLGFCSVLILPNTDVAGGFLTGLGFQGASSLWRLMIPQVSGAAAFVATRATALRLKKETT